MADRFLNLLLARVRFVVANLPVLQLVAFLLVVAATVIHIVVLPGRENAIEEAERRMASLERSARRAKIESQTERVTPEDTRQRLLDRFPSEDQLNAELGRLLEMASKEGLQIPTGDYRLAHRGHVAAYGHVAALDRQVENVAVEQAVLARQLHDHTPLRGHGAPGVPRSGRRGHQPAPRKHRQHRGRGAIALHPVR